MYNLLIGLMNITKNGFPQETKTKVIVNYHCAKQYVNNSIFRGILCSVLGAENTNWYHFSDNKVQRLAEGPSES